MSAAIDERAGNQGADATKSCAILIRNSPQTLSSMRDHHIYRKSTHYVPDHSLEPSKLTWSQIYARVVGASRLDCAHARARSSPHADAQVWRTDVKAVAAARLSHSLTWRHRVGARSKTPNGFRSATLKIPRARWPGPDQQ